MDPDRDELFMAKALALSQYAFDNDEVPVGAIVVNAAGEVIGQGWNQSIVAHDPTAHAEINAIRMAAANSANYRLQGCTLYVTLEPCTMCVGAIVHSRVKRVVFGAKEKKAGAVVSANFLLEDSCFNHRVEWTAGVMEEWCGAMISQFFSNKRAERKGTCSGEYGLDHD